MSKPTSESNAPVLEYSTITDEAQMQVDLPEPADDRTVPAPVSRQPASEPGSTTTHAEETNLEDSEPTHAPSRPRTRVRHVSPRSLSEIKSSYELVSVVYGAVHAHQQLYERAGVLHGDINPNTILILDWPASQSESSCASESESPCAFESRSPSGAAPASQSASASERSASASEPKSEKSASSSRHGADGEGEGEGRTEGALVDFDVPYSAAAWRHPRPGPYRWENHSRLRMRRYGFY